MTAEKIDQYFGKDLEAMSFAKNYHNWIMKELHPYLKGNVAEVGAGIGNVSKLILEADIKSLMAFEPSNNMYPFLEKNLELDARATTINGFFDGKEFHESFDSVVYVNVLEHIEDDFSELKAAFDALAQDGHLLIFVPALPWLYSELDKQVGHFRRYTKSHLVELTERAGLSIVKAKYFDLAGIIPWYVNFTLLRNTINGGSVSAYDRLIVPLMRVVEGWVPPPIGKNVLLVARKDSGIAVL